MIPVCCTNHEWNYHAIHNSNKIHKVFCIFCEPTTNISSWSLKNSLHGSARASVNHKLLDRQSSGPGGLKEVSQESGSPCVFSVMHLLERDKWWSDAFWVLREVKLQDFSGLIKLVSVVEWKMYLLSDPLKLHQYQENKSRLSYPSYTHRCKCAWGEAKRNLWQPGESRRKRKKL